MTAKYTNGKLLNTREAARFLRVSEASIRRWFDAGLLPGHRVGRKGERRFAEEDLLAFLNRSGGRAPAASSVNIAGVNAAVPVHVGTLFGSDEGGLRVAVPFLAEGARLKQPTFLVTSGTMLERYRMALDLTGVTVVTEFKGNTGAQVIAEWEQRFGEALAPGPTVIRLVGEMATVRPRFVSESEMLSYEEHFDVMCKRYPLAAVCQYDVRKFDGVALLRALKAHPDVIGLRSGAFLN